MADEPNGMPSAEALGLADKDEPDEPVVGKPDEDEEDDDLDDDNDPQASKGKGKGKGKKDDDIDEDDAFLDSLESEKTEDGKDYKFNDATRRLAKLTKAERQARKTLEQRVETFTKGYTAAQEQAAALEVNKAIDHYFDDLGEDFESHFGEGSSREIKAAAEAKGADKKTKRLWENRKIVHDTAKALRTINPDATHAELFAMATRARFPDLELPNKKKRGTFAPSEDVRSTKPVTEDKMHRRGLRSVEKFLAS